MNTENNQNGNQGEHHKVDTSSNMVCKPGMNSGCGCGCGCGHHHGHRHLIRTLIRIAVIILVFCFAFKMGEMKGMLESRGYEGRGFGGGMMYTNGGTRGGIMIPATGTVNGVTVTPAVPVTPAQ